jgi:hypothetical protein
MMYPINRSHIKETVDKRRLSVVSVTAETRSLNVLGQRALINGLLILNLLIILKVTLGTLGGLVPVGSGVTKALANSNSY